MIRHESHVMKFELKRPTTTTHLPHSRSLPLSLPFVLLPGLSIFHPHLWYTVTFAQGLTPFSGMVDLKVMGGSAFGSTMSQGACDVVGDLVD